MTKLDSASLVRDLAALFATGTLANLSDGQLLDQFIAHRNELCFQELIARHGPLVLALCRRSLGDPHDIEDAFQATFLILVRKASSLKDRNALSSWLYGVALRVARRARKNARRRRLREQPIAAEPPALAHDRHESTGAEVFAIVDQEIHRLPRNQQVAVILCLLEGYTHEAAATELGWPLGTVKSRIATARQTLSRRLGRRGLTPTGMAAILRPGLGLGEPLSPISRHLVRLATDAAANALAKPPVVTATISAMIASLVQAGPRMILVSRIQAAVLLAITLAPLAFTAPALLSARPANLTPQVPPPSQTRAPAPPAATAFQTPRTDLYGDPLPPGAAIRLGTVRFRHDRIINHIAYSPDGQLLVTDDRNRFFQFWDPQTGKKLRQLDSGLKHIRYFAFSPSGRTIAAVGTDYNPKAETKIHRLILTDIATGQWLGRGEWHDERNVHRVFYAPDGETVVTANETGGFQLWKSTTMRIVYREDGGGNWDVSVDCSPDPASHLVAITRPATIRFLDTETLRDIRTITLDDEHHVRGVKFSPDGMTVVANAGHKGENNTEFWLWKVSDGTRLRRFVSAKNRRLAHVWGTQVRRAATVGSD